MNVAWKCQNRRSQTNLWHQEDVGLEHLQTNARTEKQRHNKQTNKPALYFLAQITKMLHVSTNEKRLERSALYYSARCIGPDKDSLCT